MNHVQSWFNNRAWNLVAKDISSPFWHPRHNSNISRELCSAFSRISCRTMAHKRVTLESIHVYGDIPRKYTRVG